MNEDKFARHLEAMRLRVDMLNQSTDKLSIQSKQLLATCLEELQTTVETLASDRMVVKLELQEYQNLFELAPDGYLVTDASGKICKANRAAAVLFKTKQQLLVGQQLASFVVSEEEQQVFCSQLASLCKIGPVQEWELRLLSGDGASFDAAATAIAHHNTEDEQPTLLWLLRDITERKRTEAIATKVRVLESMVEGVNVFDENGAILLTNPALDAMFGYERGELLGKHVSVLNAYSSTQQAESDEILQQLQAQGAWSAELNNCKKDGTPFITYVRTSALEISGKHYWVSVHEDITEYKQAVKALRESEERYRAVVKQTSEGIFLVDVQTQRILEANAALCNLLSYTESQILELKLYDIVAHDKESIDLNIQRTLVAEHQSIGERCYRRSDGTLVDVDVNVNLIYYGGREVLCAVVHDITERKRAEATIHYQAFHDQLTGLPNRKLFNDRLFQAVLSANCRQNRLAVMFLDLDRFKSINDTLGHDAGDRLLQGVAERVAGCLHSNDTLSRWGGDEFTLLMPCISDAEDAAQMAQRILNALKQPFSLETQQNTSSSTSLHISSSIGIALYPQDGEDAKTLLKNADVALYRAKEQGRNNYRFYIPSMSSQSGELLALENQLHQALERSEFVVYYQPQVNVNTGEITTMEALLRWHHPELGLLSPKKFIPLAEENGLIVPIGEWVLRTACAQNKSWQDAGLAPLRVAVNLSARQFEQRNLGAMVAGVLSETQLLPSFLELEITESTIMQNADSACAMLHDFQAMGIHISMDDFGTGYSSLSYLKKFPFHTLKIDQSFIRDLATDPHNTAIISAVLALGRGLNLRVVAEGVETKEQLALLRCLQCEEMQGYLFSRSLSVCDATQVLQKCWLQALLIALQEKEENKSLSSFRTASSPEKLYSAFGA